MNIYKYYTYFLYQLRNKKLSSKKYYDSSNKVSSYTKTYIYAYRNMYVCMYVCINIYIYIYETNLLLIIVPIIVLLIIHQYHPHIFYNHRSHVTTSLMVLLL